jgi:hypothetical protein
MKLMVTKIKQRFPDIMVGLRNLLYGFRNLLYGLRNIFTGFRNIFLDLRNISYGFLEYYIILFMVSGI